MTVPAHDLTAGVAPPRPLIAVLQSNYLPWKGYFELMRRADLFVLLDSVQSTKNDWRNRNRIKTAQGLRWLTVPIHHAMHRRIHEVEVASPGWSRKHLRTIEQAYARAPYMIAYRPWLEDLLTRAGAMQRLSDVNRLMLQALARELAIGTPIVRAEDLVPVAALDAAAPDERLVAICAAAGARSYLSGPAASAYLREAIFKQAGLEVYRISYAGFPTYPQLHGPFEHRVSVLDALLMLGPDVGQAFDRACWAGPWSDEGPKHSGDDGSCADDDCS